MENLSWLSYNNDKEIAHFSSVDAMIVLCFLKNRDFQITEMKGLKKNKEKNLLVINCDTILNINYDKLLDYHVNQKNDFTVVAAFKKITVPYGVCEINKKQILKKIIEKPTTNNLVIVGAYCFKNKLIKHIPKDTFFNMNDFIKKLMIKKYKVGIYPISELDWQDVGEWPEYFKTISNFKNQ